MKSFLCLVLAVWMSTSVSSRHLSRRWANRPVDFIGRDNTGRALHDALAENIDQTYTDFGQRLTSVKDSDRDACFLFDLDPNIDLQDEDKDAIFKSIVPKNVENGKQFLDFVNRVGPNIANMCRRSKVFWLSSQPASVIDFDVPSKPDADADNVPAPSEMIRPPKIAEAAIPRSHPNSPHIRGPPPPPPPPGHHHRHQIPFRPTETHARNNNNNNNDDNNNNDHDIAAPPPIKAYRASHRNPPPPPPPPPRHSHPAHPPRVASRRPLQTEAPRHHVAVPGRSRVPYKAPPPLVH